MIEQIGLYNKMMAAYLSVFIPAMIQAFAGADVPAMSPGEIAELMIKPIVLAILAAAVVYQVPNKPGPQPAPAEKEGESDGEN